MTSSATSSPAVALATAGGGGWSVWFQTVQTTLTVVALCDNCLSLLVIYGLVRLTSPLRVLTSLSFADLLAAWVMMTLYLSTGNTAHHVTCGNVLHTSLLMLAHNAGALSLTSLAVSHHIATFRPLHYDSLLSSRRVWIFTAIVWTLSALASHLQYLAAAVVPSDPSRNNSYCESVASHSSIPLIISTLLSVVCLLTAAYIYPNILVYLRPVDVFSQQPAG